MDDDDGGEKVLVEVPLVNDSRPETVRSRIRNEQAVAPLVLGRGTRDLEIVHEVPTIPAVTPVIDAKVILANLALELYRAIDETAEPPKVGIEHRGCEATINALRGALLEACLLVQRVVMMPASTNKTEVDERTRQLLKLIDHN